MFWENKQLRKMGVLPIFWEPNSKRALVFEFIAPPEQQRFVGVIL